MIGMLLCRKIQIQVKIWNVVLISICQQTNTKDIAGQSPNVIQYIQTTKTQKMFKITSPPLFKRFLYI